MRVAPETAELIVLSTATGKLGLFLLKPSPLDQGALLPEPAGLNGIVCSSAFPEKPMDKSSSLLWENTRHSTNQFVALHHALIRNKNQMK